MKVFAIVPAHNEEEGIVKTLQSLVNQTTQITKVFVALDNCNDNTKEIVQWFALRYNHIFYFETVANKSKKAGALNQAFQLIKDSECDYLLQMDADSILALDTIS